ncbi:hypothetical protein GCM10011529_19700 [Polymorphobacter glacialis]|uniref:Uncharacterized protein n=1 Tax=Sandarakinorhabdus glacialis TaxID=1614636 RepID=A0A916ZTF6_9SPHN|nr:hypothetical protein GCM10011529_19700 [Polymorphobacter glacialis]
MLAGGIVGTCSDGTEAGEGGDDCATAIKPAARRASNVIAAGLRQGQWRGKIETMLQRGAIAVPSDRQLRRRP